MTFMLLKSLVAKANEALHATGLQIETVIERHDVYLLRDVDYNEQAEYFRNGLRMLARQAIYKSTGACISRSLSIISTSS